MPQWAGNPERILYLIDTTNGELRIQRNIVSVNRTDYSFYEYGTERTWGESNECVRGRMPVITYAGFGSMLRGSTTPFPWERFDYIVCDEMQNLVRYQVYGTEKKKEKPSVEEQKRNENLIAAERALREVAAAGRIRIVALSATPQNIREHFGPLCFDVPFDRSELCSLETFSVVPYDSTLARILETGIPPADSHQTGILYVTEIERMKLIFDYCRKNGIRANGFWSINAKEQMTKEQLALCETVLANETIPQEIDLLVINAASETCIKIKEENRKVDYMIIHNSNKELITQVRGRYHGDLPTLYYHDIEETNRQKCRALPDRFLGVRLYDEGQEELCAYLHLQNPKAKEGEYYKMRKVRQYLEECGFRVEYKKDSRNGGKHYYLITKNDTSLGQAI